MRLYLLLAVLLLAAGPSALPAGKPVTLDTRIFDAHWIWLKGYEEAENATVYFRKTFSLAGPPRLASLEIAADDECKVWLNGSLVGTTTAGGEQSRRIVERFDAAQFLKRGENLIAIQAVNRTGKAAVIAALAIDPGDGQIVRVWTDGSWEAASNPGEQWEKDSSARGDWQPCLDYGRAETTGPWFAPRRPSDLAALIEKSRVPLERKMVSPASVKLEPETDAAVTGFQATGVKAGQMQIKPAGAGGRVVVTADFGEEIVGYPTIIGYTYGPIKISLACGEYEAECLNPYQAVLTSELGMGALRWSAPERRAFRFARFTIEATRLVRIERIQAQTVGRRVDETGSFECSDDVLNKIYQTSARTLRLCMHEFYEDGPKRDRLLWIGDLRVEALANYYLFGDVGLARRCLLQMADLQLHDGMIPGVGPDPSSTYLPDYCAWYVVALADYFRHTGELSTLKVLYPRIRKLMAWFRANTDEGGMFIKADRPGWWIFVDWDDSMEKKDRVTAMQALYYWALSDAAEIARAVGNKRDAEDYLARAAKLKQSVNTLLWSEDKRAYVDCLTDDGPSDRVHRQPNALALLSGLAEGKMIPEIAAVLT
ncbi:MAG: MGH1-like glycoside hydrolase domain-containing protein, partial [Armatimonadota bacterium]